MFRPLTPEASRRRRAVILMVVLVLLTLFAIVGLAFVLYANMEAESSRVYREAISMQDNRIDVDAHTLANYSIGQLLFDVPDPVATAANPTPTGAWSAIRGHSLGRDIYGWNSDYISNQAANTPSIFAFNGVGRMHTTVCNPWNVDDHALLSYIPYPADGFVRDPERLGTRANLAGALPPYTGGWNSSYTYPDGNHAFLGAFDADGNVLARSFVRPYLVPSSPITKQPYLPLDPTSPNYWSWFADQNPNNAAETVPAGLRYYSLRPRNKDMALGFPPPGPGGDLRNLPINDLNPAVPALNDSVWVDLDYPVQLAPDGLTMYKPLFAFFVADLEGRVNVNTAGNVRSTTSTHLSGQGWGNWEVNPAWLGGTAGEWPQLLVGSASPNTPQGRYGSDKQPNNAGSLTPGGQLPRQYGQVDYDSSDDSGAGNVGGVATQKVVLPGQAGAPAFMAQSSFPFYPSGYNNGFAAERTNHPGIYDSQYPGGNDRRFNANQHLLELYNGNASSTSALGTDIGQLMPQTLNPRVNPNAFRIRNMVTPDSVALEIPGLTPWVFDRTATGTAYGYGGALGNNAHQPPNGPATPFPTPTLANRAAALPGSPKPQTEFTVDWRSADAVLGKVDLNRFLSPYPHLGQGTTAATYNSAPLIQPYDRFDAAVANSAAIQNQFKQAQQDRQNLADDIYRRLLRVTSVPTPAVPATPTAAELAPRRWLAQLAANIVDFIDEDEISTPFNFYNATDGLPAANVGDLNLNPNTNTADPELPKYWVFGTELPKVLINEVLAEYTTPLDGTGKPSIGKGNQFPVRVFAELFNPMPNAAQLGGAYPNTVQQQDNPTNPIPLYIQPSGPNAGYSPYNVVLADNFVKAGAQAAGLLPSPSPVPYDNDNVLGTPNTIRGTPVDTDFGNPAAIQTIDGKPATASIGPQQFFLVAPTGGADANNTFSTAPAMGVKGPGVVPAGTSVLTSANMAYNVQYATTATWQVGGAAATDPTITDGPNYDGTTFNSQITVGTTSGITVLLRRLANPHLPPDNRPLIGGVLNPAYNPYVTIDYMRNVMPQEANNTYNTKAPEYSIAKSQPYASSPRSPYLTQATANPVPTTVDTFGSYNSAASYNWLVHLDRQLINPMELLNVSGYHPHELTTRFMTPNAGGGAVVPYNHRVNWYNESNRLFRIFEFLTTRDRAAGVSALGGRQPGKVNINSIWNKEVFEALADPQTGNGFTQAQVDTIFALMMGFRSPGYSKGQGVTGQDRPFLGMGTGVMPNTDPIGGVFDDGSAKPNNTGIEDTFLRSDGKGNRLFDVQGAAHPYQLTELMTKIYGNVTTRSNTFAVWVTVGFFRVPTPVQHVDGQATGPVKLAEEIGAVTGTNIRHRIFAVIDRSRLTLDSNPLTTVTTAIPAASLNQPFTVAVAAASGTTTFYPQPWSIQTGSVLAIDVGTPSEETVVAQQVTGTSVTATFTKVHAANATVNIPGNPGPVTPGGWNISAPGFSGPTPGFPEGIVLTYTVMQ
jgi:hypothetical protein